MSKLRKCEEFRPINTLKVCQKIMENVVKIQLEQFIEYRGILSRKQSRFRKNSELCYKRMEGRKKRK